MSEALRLAEQDERISGILKKQPEYAPEIRNLIKQIEALRAVANGFISMMEGGECSILSGCCCCGDDMKRHGSPELCGHSPVDSGVYFAEKLLRDAYDAVEPPKAKEQQ